jgi:AraC-like DNA-binding protein
MSIESSMSHIIDVVAHGQDIYLEHHVPELDGNPYHTHPSIEMNYLRDCDMTYSMSGQPVTIPRDQLVIFWAAYPHRPSGLSGVGLITNTYVSLQVFLDFALSAKLVDQLLAGAVICAKRDSPSDRALFDRLANERSNTSAPWRRLHRQEVHARLTRLDVEGWDILSPPRFKEKSNRIGGAAVVHFDKMLRFIAHRAFDPISVKDVADAAGISRNYAIILFRKMLGVTVKSYILDLRIHHAKMMLIETNETILNVALDCGFTSLSSFYEAFGLATNMSPSAFRTAHTTPESESST